MKEMYLKTYPVYTLYFIKRYCCNELDLYILSFSFISKGPLPDATLTEPANQPTNLLVTFLEYCSIIMQDSKGKTLIIDFFESCFF